MTPALRVTGVSRSYGETWALRDVSLEIQAGEIWGLVGANGAGKSTLIKILTGAEQPTGPGVVEIWGRDASASRGPREAMGLGVVHQELPLVEGLSVADNLASGAHFARRRFRLIRWSNEFAQARELLRRFDLDIDPRDPINRLTQAQRTQLAVLRVLRSMSEYGSDRWLVLLDEPTASLPRSEAQRLLGWMRELAAAGGSVIFVSHRLSEVLDVADKVLVLRAGRNCWTGDADQLTPTSLTNLMIGDQSAVTADFGEEPGPGENAPGADRAPGSRAAHESGLAVRELRGETVRGVSLAFPPGRIVGVTGLVGMGYEELPYLIIGHQTPASGSVLVGGAEVVLRPWQAQQHGVVFVTGNRLEEGIWTGGSVAENLMISSLRRHARWTLISPRRESALAISGIQRAAVVPPDPNHVIGTLSGGNQQKALVARGLECGGTVLLLAEPVQGVDPATRTQIELMLKDAAKSGVAVGIFSADQEFLSTCCDEVAVMSDGVVTRTLPRDELDPAGERLAAACQLATRAET